MARFLMAWELGSGLGHAGRMAPLAEALIARGHQVDVVMKDVVHTRPMFQGIDVRIFQAPMWLHRTVGLPQPQVSLAEIVLAAGYLTAESLGALVSSWRALMSATQADAVIADYAPTALIAAHIQGLPTASLGIGFYVPFGLSSDYDNDFVGRYFADETAIEVLSLQPSIGYKLNEQWSVGMGISVNRAEGTLSKYKDHSGLCELGEQTTNAMFGAPVYNAAYCDSHYEVEGDDVAFGYTLGIHGEPVQGTRLALTYHSAIHFRLSGDSVITNTPITGANVVGNPNYLVIAPNLPAIDLATGKLAANSQLTEASKVALTTPATAAFSLDQQLTKALSVQFSAAWTEWSAFESIDIVSADANPSISLNTQIPANLNNPGQIGYIPEYWHNSWSFAAGATYLLQSDVTLKAGVAYDENPIAQSHKTARIPTDDRVWASVGANWQLTDKLSLDFAYGYLFTGDVSVNEREYNVQDVPLYNSGYQGDYSNKSQLFAVGANYSF